MLRQFNSIKNFHLPKKNTKYVNSSMPNGKWTWAKFHLKKIPVKRKNFQFLGSGRVQKAIYIEMNAQKTEHSTFWIYLMSQKCCYVCNHLWFDVKWAKVCFMSNFRHLFWLILSYFSSHRFTYNKYCSHAENFSSSTTWCSLEISFYPQV